MVDTVDLKSILCYVGIGSSPIVDNISLNLYVSWCIEVNYKSINIVKRLHGG